ncbi:unnamed protein product [Rotaria magnacalcarata]|uniref:Endonuclease/exonuclease/phosphatase domain-containing protein n=3 Tax=Rotaria magnacalcarata TaxID=392030 RepID=A0A819Z6M9_9BILA|nr:unnamed protein product [Rotaria magnacalcarata]CAF2034034.1 unnamed protein product [Rotaria magnacalcarata]CAF3915091.1 unnamed protein product [Rotaria magnacalcarata]CAF4124285.1 unnamed protein product [Rotaria magnacalcarata]CAF4169374.1 unnamed protein product [Rotaria magnacalcarata]
MQTKPMTWIIFSIKGTVLVLTIVAILMKLASIESRDDGKSSGEFIAIFYQSNRFQLLDYGTFWLSETPDIAGSTGWDAAAIRICSWVQLRDRWTLRTLYHFNTHLDHIGETARLEGTRLIADRIQKAAGSTIPTILTGDFNVGPNSDVYQTINMNTPLQDAKHLTETSHYGPNGTLAIFFVIDGLGERLDYIFVTSKHFRILKQKILTDSNNNSLPSDHLPVLAVLAIKSNNQFQ